MPNFRLINIDEAFYAVKSYVGAQLGCGKLGEWYFSESVANTLVRLLTVPKVELPDDPLEGQVFISLNRSGFQSLPREIQQQIIEELNDFGDTFCFIVTSRYMWTIGIRTLRRLYVSRARYGSGTWAGHRLIIIGQYAKEDPDHVFTDLELKTIDDCRPESEALGLYHPLEMMAHNVIVDRGYDSTTGVYFRLSERRCHGTPPWMDKFLDWMTVNPVEYPTDPVLRNLTKKEYVRDDALTIPRGYRVRSRNYPLTLGHALMSRTVWSSDPSVSMALSKEFADNFVHGVWTGCAFDIVSFGEWKERDEDWKDVSVEVKEDMIYLAVQDLQLIYDYNLAGWVGENSEEEVNDLTTE